MAVKISGTDGITAPVQPVISGRIGTALTHPAGAQKLAFNEFWSSTGITYDSGTRRFTVPRDGTYRIHFNGFKQANTGLTRIMIGVNEDAPTVVSNYGHIYDGGTDYGSMSMHSVVDLSANDYIVFYLKEGTLYNTSGDLFNAFSIELIG